jgi:hypothetical protein
MRSWLIASRLARLSRPPSLLLLLAHPRYPLHLYALDPLESALHSTLRVLTLLWLVLYSDAGSRQHGQEEAVRSVIRNVTPFPMTLNGTNAYVCSAISCRQTSCLSLLGRRTTSRLSLTLTTHVRAF